MNEYMVEFRFVMEAQSEDDVAAVIKVLCEQLPEGCAFDDASSFPWPPSDKNQEKV